MTEEQATRLPTTKTVISEASGREFVIGRPLMKHRRQIAKVVTALQHLYADMVRTGVDDGVEKVAQEMGITVEELAQKPMEEIPPDLRAALIEDDIDEGEFEKITDMQLDIIMVCLKEAPFEWDPITGTMEQLENSMEFGEGVELMRACIPYIIRSVPTEAQKKASSKKSKGKTGGTQQ